MLAPLLLQFLPIALGIGVRVRSVCYKSECDHLEQLTGNLRGRLDEIVAGPLKNFKWTIDDLEEQQEQISYRVAGQGNKIDDLSAQQRKLDNDVEELNAAAGKVSTLESVVSSVQEGLKTLTLNVNRMKGSVAQGEREAAPAGWAPVSYLPAGSTDCTACTDCSDVLRRLRTPRSGVFTVYPRGRPTRVHCDLQTAGGGWTTILNRADGSVNFDRSWNEMKLPFGDANNEHWLGLELIHQITTRGRYELLIEMDNGTNPRFAHFSSFWIDYESHNFQMLVAEMSSFSTVAHDWLKLDNGAGFSTRDRENDRWINSCYERYWKAPGWFGSCGRVNMLGRYCYRPGNPTAGNYAQLTWDRYNGGQQSYLCLKSLSMKIRRVQ